MNYKIYIQYIYDLHNSLLYAIGMFLIENSTYISLMKLDLKLQV